jgi:predicted enzyme related to lactoylglutathione lyase
MSPTIKLVLDCEDPDVLAPFWAEALGYLVAASLGQYTLLVPKGDPGPALLLQRVPEGKKTKNRMHFDVEVPDIETEAARLQELGAQRLTAEAISEFGHCWILMADPAGNEFCICDGGQPAPS